MGFTSLCGWTVIDTATMITLLVIIKLADLKFNSAHTYVSLAFREVPGVGREDEEEEEEEEKPNGWWGGCPSSSFEPSEKLAPAG